MRGTRELSSYLHALRALCGLCGLCVLCLAPRCARMCVLPNKQRSPDARRYSRGRCLLLPERPLSSLTTEGATGAVACYMRLHHLRRAVLVAGGIRMHVTRHGHVAGICCCCQRCGRGQAGGATLLRLPRLLRSSFLAQCCLLVHHLLFTHLPRAAHMPERARGGRQRAAVRWYRAASCRQVNAADRRALARR